MLAQITELQSDEAKRRRDARAAEPPKQSRRVTKLSYNCKTGVHSECYSKTCQCPCGHSYY